MASGFKTATVNSSDVPSTQSDFPAYVDLSRLGITTQAEADSVRVYADSAKTTEWARQIVSASEMWVKIPSLTSSTSIYVDYDGVSADYAATDTYGSQAVWTDYEGVWHLNESSGDALDSTANGHTLTDNNTVGAGTGQIGGARDYESGNSEYHNIADNASLSLGSSDYTVTTWSKAESLGGINFITGKGWDSASIEWFMAVNSSGWARSGVRDGANSRISNVTSGVSTGTWAYIVMRVDQIANTVQTRLNTTDGTAVGFTSTNDGTTDFAIGTGSSSSTAYYDGLIDEVRVRKDVLGDDWLSTEYNNQSDESGFWGTWTDVGGGGATFTPRVSFIS